jgi:hypothetical protein
MRTYAEGPGDIARAARTSRRAEHSVSSSDSSRRTGHGSYSSRSGGERQDSRPQREDQSRGGRQETGTRAADRSGDDAYREDSGSTTFGGGITHIGRDHGYGADRSDSRGESGNDVGHAGGRGEHGDNSGRGGGTHSERQSSAGRGRGGGGRGRGKGGKGKGGRGKGGKAKASQSAQILAFQESVNNLATDITELKKDVAENGSFRRNMENTESNPTTLAEGELTLTMKAYIQDIMDSHIQGIMDSDSRT